MSNIFKYLFAAGVILSETIRAPHRSRHKRAWKQRERQAHMTGGDIALDMLAFAGMEVLPLIYVFSAWFDFADFRLPSWTGWLGALIFTAGLVLLCRSHRDLGHNWSPTLETRPDHTLITGGVYGLIRHPIYAAIWLMVIAQPLLLHNWIGGLAGILLFLPVYLVRVPKEERMMLAEFGDAYRAYMASTGRVFPRSR
jgi:protein-S-isoprenylcysteine O-methyltransferase Ste14